MSGLARKVKAAFLVVAMCLVTGCAREASNSATAAAGTERGPTAPTDTATVEAGGEGAACSHVAAEPTYLPWLAKGEKVPDPQRDVDPGLGRAEATWLKPGAEGGGIALTRYTYHPASGPGEAVSVMMEGKSGELYFGKGGTPTIVWDTGAAECNFIELVLGDVGLERAAARRELLQVAESLRQP